MTNMARLRRDLERARAAGVSWGRGIFHDGDLPPLGTPLVRRDPTTPRQQALRDWFDDGLFKGYLDAAEQAGLTVPSEGA